MTPDLLQQWESLNPQTLGSPFSPDAPVDTFLAAQKAGISPSEVAPLASAGLPLKDPNVVINAVNLSRAGYSSAQAVDYAEKGLSPDGVAAYKKQEARDRAAAKAAAEEAAAAQQAAAVRKAQADAILASECPAGVLSGDSMLQMSPFTIEGKCFSLGSLPITQWQSATEALVVVLGTPLDIETNSPISGQVTPDGLYMGEAPLQYEAVSGAASTAYKLHYIGPDPR